MLNLNDYDVIKAAEEGADLHLEHPTLRTPLYTKPESEDEEPKPVIIRVVGRDSARYRTAEAEIASTKLKSAQSRAARDPVRAGDEIREAAIDLLARCTLSWENLGLEPGKPLPFTWQNAREVYRKFPWVREQVDSFMGSRANFLKG